jgi:hypothetical protein
MENYPDEPDNYSEKDSNENIHICINFLRPYLQEGKPIDADYYYYSSAFNLELEDKYNHYDKLLKDLKNNVRPKIKKLKKNRKRYKKLLLDFEKKTFEFEGGKSIGEEVGETMKLINKLIDKNRSHEL